MRSLVLVAMRHIKNEELFLKYVWVHGLIYYSVRLTLKMAGDIRLKEVPAITSEDIKKEILIMGSCLPQCLICILLQHNSHGLLRYE